MTKIASKFARIQELAPSEPPPRCPPKCLSPTAPPRALPMTNSSATTRLQPKTPPRPPIPDVDDEDELEAEIDAEAEPESERNPVPANDDQIDDPIRIYLMQMGEIPLLEPRRKRSRPPSRSNAPAAASATSCWPPTIVLHAAIDMLKSIRDGRTRLDRTIEVSVINIREKKRLIEGPRAEPGDAGPHHGREPQGFRRCDPQGPPDEAAPRGLAAADRPPQPRRAADRGARPADAAPAAGPGEGQARPAADGRTARASSACGRAGRQLADAAGRAEEGALPPDEDHAGKPRARSAAASTASTTWPPSTKRPSGGSRPATCGWWSPSPSATATAA